MENEKKLNPELIKKIRKATSIDELLQIAKDNDIELSKEDAEKYISVLHKTGELADDELDNVAGGGCYDEQGYLLTTIAYGCQYYSKTNDPLFGDGFENTCYTCIHWHHPRNASAAIYVGLPIKCNNENNRNSR